MGIKKARCKCFIPAKENTSRCGCGLPKADHIHPTEIYEGNDKKWNANFCTEENGITNAYGEISFLDRNQTSKVLTL